MMGLDANMPQRFDLQGDNNPPHHGSVTIGSVEVGPVAHGGHCVARYDGRVIFVRHALPGEQVMLAITDTSHDKFWRADAVEILTASPDRVDPACPVSGPGRCGGCDFQHVALPAQRSLKTAVVREQLERLAGLTWDGEVEEAVDPGVVGGLGWRTRMRYVTDEAGHLGLRAHRSRDVITVPDTGCPIAAPTARRRPDELELPADVEVQAVAAADGETIMVGPRLLEGQREVTEQAAGREWIVSADGFWQVHPAAASTLVAAVLEMLQPRPDETAFDLYCGVGLFAGALADAGCRVWGVEFSPRAIDQARRNLVDVGSAARFTSGRVEHVLTTMPRRTDLVVLDPPRTGAGKKVMVDVLSRQPRAVAYVACDPAALARDLKTAGEQGYRLVALRAFDLFPMTHHVECVALLTRTVVSSRDATEVRAE